MNATSPTARSTEACHPAACSMVARQPILDIERQLVAYELLYRGGSGNQFPVGVRSDHATLKILAEQFLTYQSRTLEGQKGFVNFDYNSLLAGVPLDFPNEEIVIEVLETCPPDDALFAALTELHAQGYTLALDDFHPSQAWERFYPLVDIIKIDVQMMPFEECARWIATLKSTAIVFLAEKVETYEEFARAQQCGFELFQGYFFQKPEVISRKKVSASTIDLFKLSNLVAKREIDHAAINDVISRNPVFSVQLLNFVNNSALLRTPIRCIEQSLHYLGDDRIRKFVSYTIVSALAPGKPDILCKQSLERAKCLESLVHEVGETSVSESAYLCGLLSLIDGMLDMAIEDVLSHLPVAPVIEEALVARSGQLGMCLQIIEAIERSDWRSLERVRLAMSLEYAQILSCSQSSKEWVNDVRSA
ncbi:EAL and HDOD domain-containing protein [Vibrio coralliilyticus]|uniref:EAL and HDOD domain-containing protein n=1 Tax=Vibrio coralliilyticus TaxID=190893 RepID=UPI000C163734|nr:HDOD domain-containing protein [Vibrio coralliilyticus]